MEGLKQRIETLYECGFVDDAGKADLWITISVPVKAAAAQLFPS